MKILVCGVGAIGSNLVVNLVPDLKGEHEITILDKDVVEERNVTPGTQRYTIDQVGIPKVEALQFNLYKWYNREVDIQHADILKSFPENLFPSFDLVIDCFDNHLARSFIHQHSSGPTVHVGFSDSFTFAVEWNDSYKVPTDITSGMDICEMPGAAAFVSSVASLGSLVIEEFIREKAKLEITGGKFTHSLIR